MRIKIPSFVPRLVPIEGRTDSFVLLEDLTIANVRLMVSEAAPDACYLFRITRDADLDLREAETEDLMESMEENLKLLTRPQLIRPAYMKALQKYMKDLQTGCEKNRCDYVLMNTARPLAQTLTEYLARRQRVRLV